MVRSWIVMLAALVGCGRIAFNPVGAGDGDGGTGNGDGKTADADNRPPAIGPVAVQYTASNACGNCASLVIPAIAPGLPDDPGYRRVVLVAVASGIAVSGIAPVVSGVMFGNVPMNGAMRVVHPGPTFRPVLELWQLLDPPFTSSDVNVTLDGATDQLEVGVIILDGVHPTQPIRTFGAGTGMTMTTSAMVLSAAGDLVIDSVCAGDSIAAQDAGNTPMINEDHGSSTTCGNFEVGRQVGAASGITSNWMVNTAAADTWVQLMASIQPP